MSQFFEFEADFVDGLQCIPMQVRLKLDTCGIKLKLNEWNHFTKEERQTLIDNPCDTSDHIQNYRESLEKLVLNHTGKLATHLPIEENPAWMDVQNIPIAVYQKAQESGVNITLEQWSNLLLIQRFALIKLSRSSHENNNFLPALQEFGLIHSNH